MIMRDTLLIPDAILVILCQEDFSLSIEIT